MTPKHAAFLEWSPDPEIDRIVRETIEWSRSILEASEDAELADEVALFGQDELKNQIKPFLSRPERFPHTLILGPPGSGKTHLARWIAAKRKEPFAEFIAPIRGPESLPRTGLILLDEVHRQARSEWLFPLMEQALTLLAATTRPELIEPAFASRFFLTLTLEPLDQHASEEMMETMLEEGPHIPILAKASAGNPRQALQIIETAIALNTKDPELILSTVRINADGLRDLHMKYLKTLTRLARPTGVNQLAILLGTNDQTIKEHERLLLELGLIDLATNGRILTRKGHRYLELLKGV